MLPKLITLSRFLAEAANSAPWGRIYPRLRVETDTEDLASPEAADDVDNEDTVENVRSGDGQEEIAGGGETEGEGEDARTGGAVGLKSASSSITT
jgi:hypothetical protein